MKYALPLRSLACSLSAVLALTCLPMPSALATEGEFVAQIRIAQQINNKSIAVAEFTNDTGEPRFDYLKKAFAESLMTKLARRPELSFVERSQLDKAIKEIGFGQTAFADGAKAAQIGKMAGANALVTGSLIKAGDRFEINVRMIDVETAKVLVSESHAFKSENEAFPAVDYLSLLIPRKLGLYVSDQEIDMARNQLRGGTVTANNDWMMWVWIGGGVVVIANRMSAKSSMLAAMAATQTALPNSICQ
jgi:TolB-like protein